MSERRKIEDRLRKKEQEISLLEEKIKAARVYVQALRDILKIFENTGSDEFAEVTSTLRPGSAVAEARQVILNKRAAVHINEILETLGREATREAKASLTSSLAAYVRRGEIFTRPAPNTFGLVELGHEMDDDEVIEPPADFGKMRSSPSSLDDEIPF